MPRFPTLPRLCPLLAPGRGRAAIYLFMLFMLGAGLFLLAPFALAAGAIRSAPEAPDSLEDEKLYRLTVFGAQLSDVFLSQTLEFFGRRVEDYVYAVGLARKVGDLPWGLELELEGMYARHMGRQDFHEGIAMFVVRYNDFPWNDVIRTSIAIGEGLSQCSKVPSYEEDDRNETSFNMLNYLLFEISLGMPENPNWNLTFRCHHRSAGYGLYGTDTGSNFYGLGLQYLF